MKRYLLDADFVLCLRSLGVLRSWLQAAAPTGPALLTSYVASHELHTIAGELDRLEKRGLLERVAVEVRSEAGRAWRSLVKSGVHKGEAEAIAWCVQHPSDQRPTFASLDAGARKAASANGVPGTDLMGFVVDLVEDGRLARDEAEQVLAVWDDKSQQRGRPADYTSFTSPGAARSKVASPNGSVRGKASCTSASTASAPSWTASGATRTPACFTIRRESPRRLSVWSGRRNWKSARRKSLCAGIIRTRAWTMALPAGCGRSFRRSSMRGSNWK